MRLSRDKIDRTRCGRSEHGFEKVVTHCKVLSVIPTCSPRTAVVVAHDDRLAQSELARRSRVPLAATAAIVLDELVQQPGIVGLLLRRIVMLLVARQLLGRIEAEGLCL